MGFLSKLLKKGEHSTNHVPQNEDSLIKRWEIPAEEIGQMQRITASEAYCKKIYRRFYRTYPEKPFISQDREYNTNWLDQAMLFPDQSLHHHHFHKHRKASMSHMHHPHQLLSDTVVQLHQICFLNVMNQHVLRQFGMIIGKKELR